MEINNENSKIERENVIILLTLKRHEDGIWIRRLVESLQQQVDATTSTDAIHTTAYTKNNSQNVSAVTMTTTKTTESNVEMTSIVTKTTIQVYALEDWLSQGIQLSSFSGSNDNTPNPLFSSNIDDIDSHNINNNTTNKTQKDIIGIVNRVSDAAPPPLFKVCCTILTAAIQIYKIPVINGPNAYAQCASKFCQHLLFQQAQLHCPNTVAYWNTKDHPAKYSESASISGSATSGNSSAPDTKEKDLNNIFDNKNDNNTGKVSGLEKQEVLIKPNSGGFGAGITAVSKSDLALSEFWERDFVFFEDGMTLIQEYIPCDAVYRVWFLNGKVQCAAKRTIPKNDPMAMTTTIAASNNTNNDDNSHDDKSSNTPHDRNSEFKGGCAANICSRKSTSSSSFSIPIPTLVAWNIPQDVQRELEDQLLPLLPDAHCGSVEFLYAPTGKRLYFDLNLLSTLPIVLVDSDISIKNVESVWGIDYDPWKELAIGILKTLHWY